MGSEACKATQLGRAVQHLKWLDEAPDDFKFGLHLDCYEKGTEGICHAMELAAHDYLRQSLPRFRASVREGMVKEIARLKAEAVSEVDGLLNKEALEYWGETRELSEHEAVSVGDIYENRSGYRSRVQSIKAGITPFQIKKISPHIARVLRPVGDSSDRTVEAMREAVAKAHAIEPAKSQVSEQSDSTDLPRRHELPDNAVIAAGDVLHGDTWMSTVSCYCPWVGWHVGNAKEKAEYGILRVTRTELPPDEAMARRVELNPGLIDTVADRLNEEIVDGDEQPAKQTEERWQAGQWLVATRDYSSWSLVNFQKGEMFLIENAAEGTVSVAGVTWGNGHPQFRLATMEEVSEKLAGVYRRLESRLGADADDVLRGVWFDAQPEPQSHRAGAMSDDEASELSAQLEEAVYFSESIEVDPKPVAQQRRLDADALEKLGMRDAVKPLFLFMHKHRISTVDIVRNGSIAGLNVWLEEDTDNPVKKWQAKAVDLEEEEAADIAELVGLISQHHRGDQVEFRAAVRGLHEILFEDAPRLVPFDVAPLADEGPETAEFEVRSDSACGCGAPMKGEPHTCNQTAPAASPDDVGDGYVPAYPIMEAEIGATWEYLADDRKWHKARSIRWDELSIGRCPFRKPAPGSKAAEARAAARCPSCAGTGTIHGSALEEVACEDCKGEGMFTKTVSSTCGKPNKNKDVFELDGVKIAQPRVRFVHGGDTAASPAAFFAKLKREASTPEYQAIVRKMQDNFGKNPQGGYVFDLPDGMTWEEFAAQLSDADLTFVTDVIRVDKEKEHELAAKIEKSLENWHPKLEAMPRGQVAIYCWCGAKMDGSHACDPFDSALDWNDDREVHFDQTVMFGRGWNADGFENRQEAIGHDGERYAVWKEDGLSKNWSAYGGADGSLAYREFDTEEQAKEAATRWSREAAEAYMEKCRVADIVELVRDIAGDDVAAGVQRAIDEQAKEKQRVGVESIHAHNDRFAEDVLKLSDEWRDELGRLVRDAWITWAWRQPIVKASWTTAYEQLSEPDKEADRCIGEALWRHFRSMRDKDLTLLLDLIEDSWSLIANAGGGNWDNERPEWKSAAERVRAKYHERVGSKKGSVS